jgi:hypothetical protein
MIPRMVQGLATVLDKILPSDLEVDLRSDRLGLSGRLDRLVTNGHVPSIIKTGFAPEMESGRRTGSSSQGTPCSPRSSTVAGLIDARWSIRDLE